MPARRFALFFAALTACGIAGMVAAQSSDSLVDRYTVLAGSKDDARKLVNGLRSSTDFKIGSTSFSTPTHDLGNGEVNIALALTEAQLASEKIATPTAEQLKAALEPILVERADGKGWGEIANGMGVRLGELLRAERARSEGRLARSIERTERIEARPERPEKFERPDKPERPEKPHRPERPERANR